MSNKDDAPKPGPAPRDDDPLKVNIDQPLRSQLHEVQLEGQWKVLYTIAKDGGGSGSGGSSSGSSDSGSSGSSSP
jgi:hypothetical protein